MEIEPVQLEKHIWLYKNVLSVEECNDLIDRYEKTRLQKKGQALFRDIVEEIEVPTFDPEDPDYNAEDWDLWQGIDDKIEQWSNTALHLYMKNYMLYEYEYAYCGCKMLYYPPLSHSPTHYDDELVAKDGGSIGVARPITLVIYLDDDFEAGETVFPDQGVIIKPVKGAIAVFPASYMYPHNTTPMIGEKRYILLPFYRKAGLNAKIEEYNKKLIAKKDKANEYRALYSTEAPQPAEGLVPVLRPTL